MTKPQEASLSEASGYRRYDRDLVAWAQDNATLLRAGRLAEIDASNIAEELALAARRSAKVCHRSALLLTFDHGRDPHPTP